MKNTLIITIALFANTVNASEHRIEGPGCVRDYEYLFTVSPEESNTAVEWVVPVYRKEAYDKLPTSKSDAMPEKTVAPRYPIMAARDGIEGHVCYVFDLDDQGMIGNLRVYESQPKKIFDKVATAAFVRWQFKPFMEGDDPKLRKNVRYCLDFKLE